jgi:hypothetical protein
MEERLLFTMAENKMNNRLLILPLLLIIILTTSCAGMIQRDDRWENRMIKNKNPYYFYNALSFQNVELVKRFLEAGADPDYCRGENGWVDSNPLNIVSPFRTLQRIPREEELPNPLPDEELIRLLVEAGADINKRPYIWKFVYNSRIERISFFAANEGWAGHSMEYILKKIPYDEFIKQLNAYISDTNRFIETLIKYGADPDKLGHPYPFSYDWRVPFLTDRRANKYFSKGSRPINEAIKKGMLWESRVDLLLRYTKLDEESLLAAQESNDNAMIEKINKLWQEQQAGL